MKAFLGYEKGEDGEIRINEREAETVKRIYYQFLRGDSIGKICSDLMGDGVLTPRKKAKWTKSTILSILQNGEVQRGRPSSEKLRRRFPTA